MLQKKNIFFSILTCLVLAFVTILSSTNIFVFVGVLLACSVLLTVLKKRKYDGTQLLTLYTFVIPILGFALFVITSQFNLDPNAEGYTAHQVLLIIGTITLPFLGYQCRGINGFNIKNVLLSIYKILALWMLINLFITMIQFGPFYSLIYKGKYFYEYGHLSKLSIDKMAYMFLGIKVERVSLELFTLFAGILTSAFLGLFFVSYEQDKKSFITYLVCGCVGGLCLLLTINKYSILTYLVLIIGFVLIILFSKGVIKYNKVTKIVIFSICGVIGVLFILFILNAMNVEPLATSIEKVWLFNKLFNTNMFSKSYKQIIETTFSHKYFYGFSGYLIGVDSLKLSGSWLFDFLLIAQLDGLILFILFIVLLFVRYVQYYKTSKDDKHSKVMLLGFILSILLVTLVGYNSMPSSVNGKYFPIFLMSPFLVLLVIYGYLGREEVKQWKK